MDIISEDELGYRVAAVMPMEDYKFSCVYQYMDVVRGIYYE